MKNVEMDDDVAAAWELLLEAIERKKKRENDPNISLKSKRREESDQELIERMKNEQTFDVVELAEYLETKGIHYSVGSLRSFRSRGEGPKSYLFGNARGRGDIIYFISDIDKWMVSQTTSFRSHHDYKTWKEKNKKNQE